MDRRPLRLTRTYALVPAMTSFRSRFRDLRTVGETLPDLDVQRAHALADRFAGPAGQGPFIVFRALYLWWLARLVRVGGAAAPVRPGEPLDIAPGEGTLVARLVPAARLPRCLDPWEKTGRLFRRRAPPNPDPPPV